ncbi:MAG TPA: RNA 2'-phosphotransferase [Fibrobacteria bacterium]|nr:RNA 2'-phosphotransferase [Fibrobacteria bacterium]HOX53441.1 RNA 2'-phosphotransferase [Fibrobacteria bacterium]
MRPSLVSKSKFLSLVLRHAPETIGLVLDGHGWAQVADLLEKANQGKVALTIDELLEIVETNEKKRFELSPDDERIRAVQGHSIDVDLELSPTTPPATLYHGSAQQNLSGIRESGIQRGKRRYVHLSGDPETALKVGARHGKPVLLCLDTARLTQAGHLFCLSKNGVWLTDNVLPEFVTFPG